MTTAEKIWNAAREQARVYLEALNTHVRQDYTIELSEQEYEQYHAVICAVVKSHRQRDESTAGAGHDRPASGLIGSTAETPQRKETTP